MSRYKPEQGRMARMAAFWSLAALLFFGCSSLHGELSARVDAMAVPVGGQRIPILGIDLTPAFLISAVLFLGGMFLLYRLTEKPKNADVLIETEAELKKVTWPTTDEVINSSVVVVVSVLFIMGFLAVADWFIGRVTRVLLGI